MRLKKVADILGVTIISIHALARSATQNIGLWQILDWISIHALARSATLPRISPLHSCPYFNPRTREECDLYCSLGSVLLSYFNPRTREECDGFLVLKIMQASLFQSTHSRGVRRFFSFKDNASLTISIHALARSATLLQEMDHRSLEISIHALARSATFLDLQYFTAFIFQSTHSRGVRLLCTIISSLWHLFQSTHSRGVRLPTAIKWFEEREDFNPRTREECDF